MTEERSKYSWIRYIKNRIKRNKNFLGIISGSTGSGKSWSAISICEMLDPDFNIDRIVFKGKDLMRLVNYGNLKKGSVILWDETQIDLNNRNWQSLTNKMLNYLISTFRHKCFILLFTSPYTDFLDTATLKLFHANFETYKIDTSKKAVVLKPKMLQYNQDMRKWYRKYLKINRKGRMRKVKKWSVPKPSDKLIEVYEEKKTRFTSALNKDIEDKLDQLDNNGVIRKPLTLNQENILECWKSGMFKGVDIAQKLGRSPSEISQSITSMRKKGYKIENYRENVDNVPNFKENRPTQFKSEGSSFQRLRSLPTVKPNALLIS